MQAIIDKLTNTHNATDQELLQIIKEPLDSDINALLAKPADQLRRQYYGTKVYTRGLIEFTNYCKNNCYYCGIRAGNNKAERYRLTEEDILLCCQEGYELGFRTFVLQGGEDLTYSDAAICSIVSHIKKQYPDCAVTLSIGEKERSSYQAYFDAGADRYLLRHETATPEHYSQLHPTDLSLEHRKECLFNLKDIGYQVGSGFMVGSPYQTPEHILADLRFLQELKPAMIGIGPFIRHQDTPFKAMASGTAEMTLRLVSLLRLLFPSALIPSTTALGTIAPDGRERGLKAGANVVMPNLSPTEVRKKYLLYDNKICTGDEAAQCRHCLEMRVRAAGYALVTDRGDVWKEK